MVETSKRCDSIEKLLPRKLGLRFTLDPAQKVQKNSR